MNYAGLLTHNDNRGVWGSANGDTTLDTATAPYLSWTLTLDAGTTVSNPTFFINLAKVDGSGTQLDLRSSLDDYAVSLGSPSSVDGTYRNYMFPVGESLSDSVTFRLYVYDVSPGMQTDSDNIYNVWCQSYYTTSGDTYNANMQGQNRRRTGECHGGSRAFRVGARGFRPSGFAAVPSPQSLKRLMPLFRNGCGLVPRPFLLLWRAQLPAGGLG